jgi:hypothetical protein
MSGTAAGALAAKAQARLGIVAAQFGQHVGEILVIDAADALAAGRVRPGDQIEVVDQPGHAGIVAIGLARLQRDAFGQAASRPPRWDRAIAPAASAASTSARRAQFARRCRAGTVR